MEIILVARLPAAALPSPKTLAQPWGDAADSEAALPLCRGGSPGSLHLTGGKWNSTVNCTKHLSMLG